LFCITKNHCFFCFFQSSKALLFELKWQIVLKVAAAAAAARFKGFLKPKAIPPGAFFLLLLQQQQERAA
jgi:hypothetical protein